MDLITSSFANVFRLEVIELDDRENVLMEVVRFKV